MTWLNFDPDKKKTEVLKKSLEKSMEDSYIQLRELEKINEGAVKDVCNYTGTNKLLGFIAKYRKYQ